MPSFNHMRSEVGKLEGTLIQNEFVVKMVKTMQGYHEFAYKQTLKNKERLNTRVRQPLEYNEYEPGQKFMRVKRPVSRFKSSEEEEAWKISMKLMERYEGPYTVIRRINPILYDADIDGVQTRVHAQNMKPF